MPVINPSVPTGATYEDLDVTDILRVDDIHEYTAGHGVEIDSVLLKDNTILATSASLTSGLSVNSISEYTANAGITLDGSILVKDSIIQNTGGTFIIRTNGSGQDIKLRCNDDIYIQPGIAPTNDSSAFIFDSGGDLIAQGTGNAIRSSGAYLYLNDPVRIGNLASDPASPAAGTLYYNTANAKVTLYTTAWEPILSGVTIAVNTINEASGANGVLIDGVRLRDGAVVVDTISEATGGVGVTVDGVLLKDGGIVCADAATIEVDTINEATAAAGVTVDGVRLVNGGIICADAAYIEVDTINEATADAGVTIEGVQFIDGGVTMTPATFTPYIEGNGNGNNFTCSTATGTFVQFGRMVMYRANWTITSINSATGDVRFQLPVECIAGSSLAVVYTNKINIRTGYMLAGRATTAASDMGIVGSIDDAPGFNLAAALDLTVTCEIWVAGCYISSS